ncbi:LuxR C-terminal-related transcriptional regulator [Streptomyces sp. NPDC056468]|uniref:helix-turn-helix transcriptional regulator n=1 Tax=Streptomyces sp. NPDC056468 TaxID=3345830 RepID=UPI0036850A2A
MGKTRLLTEFLDIAAEIPDVTVVPSTAAERQHGPFDGLGSLPALHDLAGPGGLVLLVDDVHDATHQINIALEQLLRHPPRTDLLVVLAYRPRGIANRLLAALGAAQSQWHIEELPLTGLSGEAVGELIPERLCGRHQMTLHQESGGNPRYLQLLMSLCQGPDCRGESLLRTDAQIPVEVAAPMLMDLDRLSATARLVAQSAAVVGDTFELEVASAVAELDHPTVLVALDELLARDLIQAASVPGRFGFRHSVVRGVVYRTAPDGWRLGAHARAIDALHSRNQPAVRIAEHVERVGGEGPERGAALIAAARAIELSDPDTAAAWYRTALRLTGDGSEHRERRRELLTALARGAVLTGRLSDGWEALSRRDALVEGKADVSADAAMAIECRAVLARYAGRYTEARAMLHRAVNRSDGTVGSTRLRLALAATTVWDTGWDWSEDALLGAVGSGDQMLQSLALAIHATAALAKGASAVSRRSASEAAQLIERQTDDQLAHGLDAVWHLGFVELHLERRAQAARRFGRGLALSKAYGQWQSTIPLLVGLGSVHLRQGHLESARSHAEQAIRLAQSPGCEDLLAMALTLRARTALAEGAVLNSLADSRAACEAVTPDSPTWRQARLAQAAARLANDDPAGCLAAVLDAGGGPTLPELPMWDHPRAHDLMGRSELALGRRAEARAWVDRHQAAAEKLGLPGGAGPVAMARARVADDPAEVLAHALEAIDAGTANEQVLEAGTGHLLASQALLALGAPAGAEKHLDAAEAAVAGYAALDLAPRVRELRSELHAATVATAQPPAEQYMLSQREFEIARLVSQGRTNRQIARQLEVSHKTVETHLGRIFTKLNVSSRAEIASMVGRSSVIARPRRTAAAR